MKLRKAITAGLLVIGAVLVLFAISGDTAMSLGATDEKMLVRSADGIGGTHSVGVSDYSELEIERAFGALQAILEESTVLFQEEKQNIAEIIACILEHVLGQSSTDVCTLLENIKGIVNDCINSSASSQFLTSSVEDIFERFLNHIAFLPAFPKNSFQRKGESQAGDDEKSSGHCDKEGKCPS